jgi:hypothetical protein
MLFDLKVNDEKQKMIDMICEYRNKIQPVITAELKKEHLPGQGRTVVEQSKSVWFRKSEVIEFLDKHPEANGIRLYFAAHDKSTYSEPENHSEYQGQLTVVIVATQAGTDSNDVFSSPDMLQGWAMDKGSICLPDCGHHILTQRLFS